MKRIMMISSLGLLVFGVIVFGIGVYQNSYKLETIRVTLNAGAEEHEDKHFMGIGEEEKNPDYRLLVRDNAKWHDLGVRNNTQVGSGLDYKCNETIPFRQILELRFEDDDTIEDDVLEQMPISGPTLAGNRYSFVMTKSFDIQVGFSWFFFQTAIGKIISVAMVIAIVILILSSM